MVSVFCAAVAVSSTSAMLRIWKSSLPMWRAVSSAVTAILDRIDLGKVVDRDGDGAHEALPEDAQHAGGQRHEDDVVLDRCRRPWRPWTTSRRSPGTAHC